MTTSLGGKAQLRFAQALAVEVVGDFVVAGFAAGQAVVEAVLAKADIELRLAEAAVSLAVAAVFAHFALGAAVLLGGCSHGLTLTRRGEREKCRW
jgi:hypothetical protein